MSEILQSDPQDDGEPPSYNFLNYDVTEARRPASGREVEPVHLVEIKDEIAAAVRILKALGE